jgi:hypothetical protein
LAKEGAGLQSNWQIKRSYMAQVKQERMQTGECSCFTCLERIVLAEHPELAENQSVAQRKPDTTSPKSEKQFELKEVVAYADSQVPAIHKESDTRYGSPNTSSRKPSSSENVSVAKQVPIKPSESYLGIENLEFGENDDNLAKIDDNQTRKTAQKEIATTEPSEPKVPVRQETAVAPTPDPNALVKFDLIHPKSDQQTLKAIVANKFQEHAAAPKLPTPPIASTTPPENTTNPGISQPELDASIKRLAKSNSQKNRRLKSTLDEMQSAISDVKSDLNQMRATLDEIPERIEQIPNQIAAPASDLLIVVTQPPAAVVPEPTSDAFTDPVQSPPQVRQTSPVPTKLVVTTTEKPIILRARADERSVGSKRIANAQQVSNVTTLDQVEFSLEASQFRPLPEMRTVGYGALERGLRADAESQESGPECEPSTELQMDNSEKRTTGVNASLSSGMRTNDNDFVPAPRPIVPQIPRLHVSTLTQQIQPLPPIVNITSSPSQNASRLTQPMSLQQISAPITGGQSDDPRIRWEFPGQYAPIYSSDNPDETSIDRQAVQPDSFRRMTARPVGNLQNESSTATIER